MSITIDLTKLKRVPSKDDIERAAKFLENKIPVIIEKNRIFFEENKYPKKIDYLISHSMTDGTGLITYKVPYLVFPDPWLSQDIKEDVTKTFFDSIFSIINGE